ncbi:MAG: hypothetical protein DRI70_09935, partial [Bacteroidetes bacterium]
MIKQRKYRRTYISKSVSRVVLTVALLFAGTLIGQQLQAQDRTLTVNVVGTGTVTQFPLPTLGVYTNGTVVTLTPVAGAGWAFTGWSGHLSGSASPQNITMSGNRTVTATFEQIFTLTVNITGNGTVTQDPLPTLGVYTNGTVVTLTPVADPGWAFTGWSTDLSGQDTP